jgi:hypothetical protein
MPLGSHFKPWEGKGYGSEDVAGLRLMVLGESHYAAAEDDSDSLTVDVVRAHLSGARREGFLSLWSSLLAGKGPFAHMSAHEVIESVVFSNFVQALAGEHHDNRPTETMWAAAALPFCGLLDERRPDAVLVLGQATWNHVRFEEEDASKMEDHRDEHRTWTRPDGHQIVATWINHPRSRGFSSRKWEDRVNHFLERAATACKKRRSST